MKKVIYSLIVFVISASVACKKDKDSDKDDHATKDLIGSWALIQVSPAMGPVINYPYGTEHILTFDGNKYYMYESGELVKEGTFTAMADTTVEQNVCLANLRSEFTRRIVFDTAFSAQKIFFRANRQELVTMSGCYAIDAGVKKVYARLNTY